uniref:G-protein coupled receptors family 2 profile 1 domain-containing protein n=1 Tax=Sinocyclocheilus grahami TaxID=75366 RepID=A0A672K1A6_SINGR
MLLWKQGYYSELKLTPSKPFTIYTNECIQSLTSAPPAAGPVCNRTFDQYVCWPDGSPGTAVNVSCPWYLPWYRKGKALTLCLKPTTDRYNSLLYSRA